MDHDVLGSQTVIDRASPTPAYLQIRNFLATRIQTGVLQPGDQLPLASKLQETLAVSPQTLNRAIQELKRDGWVHTRRGVGVFVAAPQPKDADAAVPQTKELRVRGLSWLRNHRIRLLNEFQRRVPGASVKEGARDEDVKLVDIAMLPVYAHELQNLNELFLPALSRPDANDMALRPFSQDGQVLTLGSCAHVGVVVVNRKLFVQAGVTVPDSDWSLDALLAAAKRMHDPVSGRYGLAFMGDYLDFLYLLWREGGELFDESGEECLLDSAAAIRAMERFHELSQYSPSEPATGLRKAFMDGRAAMMIGYNNWNLSHLTDDHAVICLPEYRRGIVPMDGAGWGIRKGTPAQSVAVEFLRLFLESETWRHKVTEVPLCVDRARQLRSVRSRACEETLPYARKVFAGIDMTALRVEHDIALNLVRGRTRAIVKGAPAEFPERMRELAVDVKHLLQGKEWSRVG